jgi:hypothetical protein
MQVDSPDRSDEITAGPLSIESDEHARNALSADETMQVDSPDRSDETTAGPLSIESDEQARTPSSATQTMQVDSPDRSEEIAANLLSVGSDEHGRTPLSVHEAMDVEQPDTSEEIATVPNHPSPVVPRKSPGKTRKIIPSESDFEPGTESDNLSHEEDDASGDDEDDVAEKFWAAAADTLCPVLSEHVNRSTVNDELFDIGAIPAADADRYTTPTTESRAGQGAPTPSLPANVSGNAGTDLFVRLPEEDDQTFAERVRNLKM